MSRDSIMQGPAIRRSRLLSMWIGMFLTGKLSIFEWIRQSTPRCAAIVDRNPRKCMPNRPEHINIKRVSAKDRRSAQQESESTPPAEPHQDAVSTDLIRRYKIVAVLLTILSIMVLIAMASYTDHDADNAQLSIRDVMGVLRGDEAMRVRFDTTHNWLGLLGAVISHWLIHHTVGRFALLFPILLGIWARDLYRVQRIAPLTVRRSFVAMGAVIMVASIAGTLQQISWLGSIDASWSGAIGQFVASVTTQFVGIPGSLLVLVTGLAFTLILGLRLQVSNITLAARLQLAKLRDLADRWRPVPAAREAVASPVDAVVDEPALAVATEVAEPDEIGRQLTVDGGSEDEPAEMLRGMTQPQTLSPAVKILRHVPKGSPKTPPTEPPGDETTSSDRTTSIDLDIVQQRLSALHPTRTIDLRSAAEAVDRISDEPPPQVDEEPRVEPPPTPTLTVLVEEAEPEETVDNVGGTLQYDEQIVYKTPTADLLFQTTDDADIDDTELRNNARILQEKLETFRIKIENLTVQPGPVVTQYEFVPAAGIKVSQIESLADDIALALKAQGVR
ncbi:MAG: hypothetical protein FGM24_07645, partial [Candidatus Kapabacteria bacterium]|nr:hypothetical protein [Candidatus Kapabacteria bacterium]